uniref:Uncharacterized protein n=1 Tax=Panagrolaimus davidi TaxID=227884 RepID=A0A914P6I4_9BILA
MQRLFELYYVLDLKYDFHMKDLFQLLEYLMGMKTVPGVGVKKLAAAIQHFYDNPNPNFLDLTNASSGETTTDFNDFDPFDGIDLITGLRTDTASTTSTQEPASVSTVASTDEVITLDTPSTSSTQAHSDVRSAASTTEDDDAVAHIQPEPRTTLAESSDFVISHSLSPSNEVAVTSSHHFSPSVSRGRGQMHMRIGNRQSSFATSIPTTSQQTSSSFFNEPPPKRGRGRPRKNPPPMNL